MTSLKELVQLKINLQLQLQAIAQCNVYGRKNEELVAMEMDKIKAQRALHDVEKEINDFVEGRRDF